MTATVEQLDLWGETEPVLAEQVPGIGRTLSSPCRGWRARWTGSHYGWQIDRAITWTVMERVWVAPWHPVLIPAERSGWENWEPDLPYGVEHITTRDEAIAMLLALVDQHGDDPRWLERARG